MDKTTVENMIDKKLELAWERFKRKSVALVTKLSDEPDCRIVREGRTSLMIGDLSDKCKFDWMIPASGDYQTRTSEGAFPASAVNARVAFEKLYDADKSYIEELLNCKNVDLVPMAQMDSYTIYAMPHTAC